VSAEAEDDRGRPRRRVVIADDVALLREGLRRLLEDDFDVVATAGDGDELERLVAELLPDVAIIDIRMPPTQTTEGLVAARRIRERHPGVALLLLSHHLETYQVVELLADDSAGVGYLLKDRVADVERFVESVRLVAEGECVIDPEVVLRLVERPRPNGPLARLPEKEREVLGLVAEGRSNRGIAARLFLSVKTVETHLASIFVKLDLLPAPEEDRRVLAVLRYLQQR